MLCHDGANPTLVSEKSSKTPDDTIQPNGNERYSKRVVFRSLIYLMINRGYNVALINGLGWMDTKVCLTKRLLAVT